MTEQSAGDRGSPVTFRFSNIGPVKDASLQLGRLTVIAGRNNTGKTYIAYSLYGFLKTWRRVVATHPLRLFLNGSIRDAADMFRRGERATIPLPLNSIGDQRNALLKELAAEFSRGLPGVFSSRRESFRGSNLDVSLNASAAGQPPSSMEAPIGGTGIAMGHDGAQFWLHETDFATPVPPTRLSDGMLRLISVLAALFSPSPPALLCIEEPELGLHPDTAASLADVLMEASGRIQLVVTTHSASLLSGLSTEPDTVVTCERPGDRTVLERLDPEKLALWLDDYTLGDVWRMGALGANP